MKKWMIFKGLKFGLFIFLAALAFGGILMLAWNWLMPELFGLPELSLMQAIIILMISRLLFGGWFRGGGHYMGHWRSRIRHKMSNMTPEERDKFRQKYAGRCGPRGRWSEDRPKTELT